jgi:hypothetical protein
MFKRFQIIFLVTLLVVAPLSVRADITVSLTKGFVQKNKDRATISTTFSVDHFHKKPNKIGTGSEDGDIHIAGRDSVVFLPMVAEILNGKRENDTFNFLMGLSEGKEISLTGVWRLWFEHPGSEDQIQKKNSVPIPENTNPDHIFEFHPITKFGNFDCRDSFLPVADGPKEFRGYSADKAFADYENGRERLRKPRMGS